MTALPHLNEFILSLDSQNTRAAYQRVMHRLLKYTDFQPPTPELLWSFALALGDDGLKPATRRTYLTAIKAYYDYLYEYRHISTDEACNVDEVLEGALGDI